MNPKVWELYKQRVTGTKPEEKLSETTVEALESNIEAPGLKVGKVSQASFILRNTGNVPLVIKDIKSSCGGTVPDWDKSPVKPGEETQIRVEIKPEESNRPVPSLIKKGGVQNYGIKLKTTYFWSLKG
jgi:hypothetical protein